MSAVVAFQNEAELRLLLGRVGVREFRWSYANVCMYVCMQSSIDCMFSSQER